MSTLTYSPAHSDICAPFFLVSRLSIHADSDAVDGVLYDHTRLCDTEDGTGIMLRVVMNEENEGYVVGVTQADGRCEIDADRFGDPISEKCFRLLQSSFSALFSSQDYRDQQEKREIFNDCVLNKIISILKFDPQHPEYVAEQNNAYYMVRAILKLLERNAWQFVPRSLLYEFEKNAFYHVGLSAQRNREQNVVFYLDPRWYELSQY